jgi:UV DNA damage repair endonuclease
MEDGNFSERRKHSFLIHYVPKPQLIGLTYDMIDVDVEAKGKNIALFKMRKDFNVM